MSPTRAMFFGRRGHTLFGWLHPAVDPTPRLGLVICAPFGFESVCGHRTLKALADASAQAGVPALRFDYAGCGDSFGDEFDHPGIAAWLQSVHAAIDALQRASGVRRVALLGLRLGATLAWLAAAERDDVHGLVAIAPVLQGRNYLRELKLLGQTSGSIDGHHGLLEAMGFVMPHATCESLACVNLYTLDRPPAPRVLIVERDDLDADEKLPALPAMELRREHWPGYAAMMADPQHTQVPQAIVEGVVRCLGQWQASAPSPSHPRPAGVTSTTLHAAGLLESAVWIDAPPARLFGVLTLPSDVPLECGVLMPNAGSVHHIGPDRLWVQLARRWAAKGIASLRVDIAGIGDSDPAPGNAPNVVYPPQAMRDVAAAANVLRQRAGIEEVHVLGLCSGAYHAFEAAVQGHAIASALMVNPQTFHWREGMRLDDLNDSDVVQMTARYRRAWRDPTTWRRLVRGEIDVQMVCRAIEKRLAHWLRDQWRELARAVRMAPADDLALELERCAKRGVPLHFIFATGHPGLTLLRSQAGRRLERLVRRGAVSVDLVPGADHTFTQLRAREQLVQRLDTLLATPAHQNKGAPRGALSRIQAKLRRAQRAA